MAASAKPLENTAPNLHTHHFKYGIQDKPQKTFQTIETFFFKETKKRSLYRLHKNKYRHKE